MRSREGRPVPDYFMPLAEFLRAAPGVEDEVFAAETEGGPLWSGPIVVEGEVERLDAAFFAYSKGWVEYVPPYYSNGHDFAKVERCYLDLRAPTVALHMARLAYRGMEGMPKQDIEFLHGAGLALVVGAWGEESAARLVRIVLAAAPQIRASRRADPSDS